MNQAERALADKLAEVVDDLAEATVQVIELRSLNMALSSRNSELTGVCDDLRKRLEGSDSVLLRRDIFDLQKSNEDLRRMLKEKA